MDYGYIYPDFIIIVSITDMTFINRKSFYVPYIYRQFIIFKVFSDTLARVIYPMTLEVRKRATILANLEMKLNEADIVSFGAPL